jgi:hypothetical protein
VGADVASSLEGTGTETERSESEPTGTAGLDVAGVAPVREDSEAEIVDAEDLDTAGCDQGVEGAGSNVS